MLRSSLVADLEQTCTARLAVIHERVEHLAKESHQLHERVAAMKASVIDHDRALVEIVGRDGHAGMLRQMTTAIAENTATAKDALKLIDDNDKAIEQNSRLGWKLMVFAGIGSTVGSVLVGLAIKFIFGG